MPELHLPPDGSLDAKQDPPGDRAGNPRSSAELLDNLRLRLAQLAENHPSAVTGCGRARQFESERALPHERDDHGPREQACDDQGDSVGHDTTRGGGFADLVRGVKDVAGALSGSQGTEGPAEIGLAASRSADPYRPWFMAGDPATPWFAIRSGLDQVP